MRSSSILSHPLVKGGLVLGFLWLVVPLLPEELRFSFYYRVYITLPVVMATLFFMLLRKDRIEAPKTRLGAYLSIFGTYAGIVGFLVFFGTAYPYPQLPIPKPESVKDLPPAERGKRLFFGGENLQPQCAMCHMYKGKGGRRAPNMDGVGVRAETRVPGVAAKDYIRNHILLGSTVTTLPGYKNVAGFVPMMPPFKTLLKPEQVDALVAFLSQNRGTTPEVSPR